MAGKNRAIILLPQAQRDLDNIRKASPQAAEDILSKIGLLEAYPELGPRMDQAFDGYRQLVQGKYRIIYEVISPLRLEIAYLRHSSRQLGLRIVSP